MTAVRHILFTLVLLIILGHASFAHSHERAAAMCQIESPAERSIIDVLMVAVTSNTGSHHLEDFKPQKAATAIVIPTNTSAVLKWVLSTIEQPVYVMADASYPDVKPSVSFHPFYTIYTLRGSPC